MHSLFWIACAFWCGSLTFSVWLGKIVLHQDIRAYGDANPGAANVFRAGGKGWGWIAILLEMLKGAVPVGLANFGAGMTDWSLAAIALAPIVGHAFSPFLRFKGGKTIAVSLGIWCGLTLYQVPSVLGLLWGSYIVLLTNNSWSTVLGVASLIVYLLLSAAPVWLWGVWLGNLLIVIWKHRTDLTQPTALRPWVKRLLGNAPAS
ncbi:glycerol-3-phosphate acyltransferase PlsY [Thermoflexales bacterium]|nr:glycerol-3-phosphate acyltransferase PlsY [Thermoflexales bacterium]